VSNKEFQSCKTPRNSTLETKVALLAQTNKYQDERMDNIEGGIGDIKAELKGMNKRLTWAIFALVSLTAVSPSAPHIVTTIAKALSP